MNLFINDILVYADKEQKDRVLWISENGIALIDLEAKDAMPRLERRVAIEQLIENNNAVVSKTKSIRNIQEDKLTEEACKVRDKRWESIREIVAQEPQIYIASQRGQLITASLEKYQTSKPTLYLSLRRYWQRGKSPNALLPDFDKCGAPGRSKVAGDKKLGRPRKYGQAHGINIDESDKKIIRVAVKRFYLNESELSLREAYNSMIRVFYNEGMHIDAHGKETPVISSSSEYPTLRQFRYWYEKERDIRHAIESRKGKIAYAKDFRPILGTSTAEVYGPGSRFQIDATIADVYLVSRLDPNKIVGRPVLYFVVDVFSRMVVGMYVGIEGPSWVTAMMALANAASNKVEYCKQYGITISEEDWPSHYLPNAIIGDRGEMLCSALDNLINNFGVKIENTPPYRPDWKGIVEQSFNILQAKFKPYAPGYVKQDFQQRGARDYRLDAALNLYEFTKIMIEIVIHYNNANELTGYDADEYLVPNGVAPIPIELWNWGIVNRSGRLKSHDGNDVRLSLLPRDRATVTELGIEFRHCFYSCESALKERWFEKSRANGRWKIDVSYDPRSMDTIYFNGTGDQRYEPCLLLERSRQYQNQSLWEIEEALHAQKSAKAERSQRRLQSDIALAHTLDKIKTEALNRKEEYKLPSTNAEKIRNIRGNRRVEREIQRPKEAFTLPKELAENPEVISIAMQQSDDLCDDDLDLLRAGRKKRWRDEEIQDNE